MPPCASTPPTETESPPTRAESAHTAMDWIEAAFSAAQQQLFEAVVRPLLFAIGLGNLLEDGYLATGWLLVGLLQLAVMVAVIAPLQRWRYGSGWETGPARDSGSCACSCGHPGTRGWWPSHNP